MVFISVILFYLDFFLLSFSYLFAYFTFAHLSTPCRKAQLKILLVIDGVFAVVAEEEEKKTQEDKGRYRECVTVDSAGGHV